MNESEWNDEGMENLKRDQIPEGVMDTDPGLDGPYPALDENGKLIEPYDSDEERAEAQKRFTFWTQYTGAN